mmetsp:Transcript_37595/g.86879  ORF Transcript_37595/g.86879 Transcript_37595/m.86879 type:complete len:99 (+) Transcript_37595:305-601(+)
MAIRCLRPFLLSCAGVCLASSATFASDVAFRTVFRILFFTLVVRISTSLSEATVLDALLDSDLFLLLTFWVPPKPMSDGWLQGVLDYVHPELKVLQMA